jgi:RNA ligase
MQLFLKAKKMINKDLLRKLLADEYVMVQKHPDAELYIYNYTRKAQFENFWNEITLLTRGLILDADMNIVARPFLKFFNYEQLKPEEIPVLPFDVYEKMDGSLGILYWLSGNPYIASRGSFASDQAKHANEVLYSRYQHTFDKLNKNATYLFEIIYPENRIVVDYKGKDDLVLLAVIDNTSGDDLSLEDIGFEIVKRYDGVNDFTKLRDDNDMAREGYIVKFRNGFRMKMKYAEYCRLHSVVTGVSNVTVWEYLSQNKSFDELLERTPDEFDSFIKRTAEFLNYQYTYIESDHKNFMRDREIISPKFKNRKEQAEVILSAKHFNTKILFEMLDGKDYSKTIWSMIRPKWSKPFMNDDEN